MSQEVKELFDYAINKLDKLRSTKISIHLIQFEKCETLTSCFFKYEEKNRENFISYRVSKQELVTSRRDSYKAVKHTKHSSAVPVSGSSPFVHARFYLKGDEVEKIHPFSEQSPIFTFCMGTAEVPRILEDCLKTVQLHDYVRFEFSVVAFYCIKEMLDLWNSSIAKVESPGLESFSRWYLEDQDEDAENEIRYVQRQIEREEKNEKRVYFKIFD